MQRTATRWMGSNNKAWLQRQFNDPYVKMKFNAEQNGIKFRSRSAFKLLEMDSKYRFLKRGRVVVDIGAAPGGWSQVASAKMNFKWWDEPDLEARIQGVHVGNSGTSSTAGWSSATTKLEQEMNQRRQNGVILAVDLLPIDPIPGVKSIQGDFLAAETQAILEGWLPVDEGGRHYADLVLCDMSENHSGNKIKDSVSSLASCETAFQFASKYLRATGSDKKRDGCLVWVSGFPCL